MKISNSKKQLAKIISESGGWRDGAEWAAQDKDWRVSYFDGSEKPVRPTGKEEWWAKGYIRLARIKAEELLTNWHQTILSREDYFRLYPALDADGWIEWGGGECPVCDDIGVSVRFRSGETSDKVRSASEFYWKHDIDRSDIIAYRLHKQAKPEFCESVVRSIPEPTAKPTIEQLATDYRNKLDYANRKQDEADKANMESDAALSQLEDAIAAIGFIITPLAATEKEPELVITDWRDLQVGDEIEVFNFECPESESRRKQELMSGPCIVMQSEGGNVRIELKKKLPTKGPHWNATGVDACDFKFIRRP